MTWTKELIEFRKRLAELYPTRPDMDLVLDTIGLHKASIAFNDRAIITWNSILNEADNRGMLLALSEYVGNDFSNDDVIKIGVNFIKNTLKKRVPAPIDNVDVIDDSPVNVPKQKGVNFMKSKAMALLEEDDIEIAIDILLTYVEPISGDFQRDFTLLAGRNSRNNKDNNKGILPRSEYTLTRNSIRHSLISYIVLSMVNNNFLLSQNWIVLQGKIKPGQFLMRFMIGTSMIRYT